jgi:hypothetical protein
MAGHRSKGYLSNDRRIDGIGLFMAMDRYIALQDADLFTFQTRILQDTDETNFTYLIRRSDFPVLFCGVTSLIAIGHPTLCRRRSSVNHTGFGRGGMTLLLLVPRSVA